MTQTSMKLTVTTPNDLHIVMTRVFDAPRRLVWDAMTKPGLVRKWLFAPPDWKMTVCEGDVRPGGTFRWQWAGPDGKAALMIHGTYHEVVSPERIVHTETMEMGPGAAGCGSPCEDAEPSTVLVTLELDEQGGQTHMKMTIACPTKEVRDAMLASGMDQGMEAGYQQLDAILAQQVRH